MTDRHIRAALQRRDRLAWRIGTALVLAVFVFDLVSVLAPGSMARPLVTGSAISTGVAIAFMIVFGVIGAAIWFVQRLNRRDASAQAPRDGR